MSPTPLSSRGPDSSHHYGISSSAIIASTRNLRRFYENLHYLSVKIIALLHLQTHLQFVQKNTDHQHYTHLINARKCRYHDFVLCKVKKNSPITEGKMQLIFSFIIEKFKRNSTFITPTPPMKNSPTLFSSDTEKWNTFGEKPYPLSQSTKSAH